MYRAHDMRLKRSVAVKILPASFASDHDRLRRFQQEARAVAALNHPNILAIHDIGTQDGTSYLVSEFLEGNTLRAKLAGTALPTLKAIEYALQIAQGWEPPTTRASFIATSSRRISSSQMKED